MKKIVQIWFMAALLLGGLAGCYDDKGNYDYKDINEMTYTIKASIKGGNEIAVDSLGYSRCKQSPEDITIVYTPVVTQSMLAGEGNLVYEWRVVKQGEATVRVDTVKELELEFPKNTASEYNITFRVTDNTTNISFYKSLRIKTVQPYLNSWFVLNGEEGECRLSVVEEPDSLQYVISYDGYGDLGLSKLEERKVIREANAMIYSPYIDMNSGVNPELLQLVTKDGIWKMKPNTLTMTEMRINSDLSMVGRMEGSVASGSTVTVDERGQLYLSTEGVSYDLLYPKDENYRVDVISHNLGETQAVGFWDNSRKKFGYAETARWGKPSVSFIEAQIEDAEEQEILWIGPEFGDATKDSRSFGMAIGRNKSTQEYTVYHITQDDKNEYVITPQPIGLLKGTPSEFATAPYAWASQFFYISGNSVYRFNGTDESIEIYDAGNPIRQLKFRILNQSVERDDEIRILGLAVEGTDGWELHQISLTNGGDLEENKTKVFEGFGPIRDFCFSFRNSLAD
ncbi:MAG: hypothetical protein K2L23_08000 [Odoribacter sp.]|nr:hypothetical protein [Odoribacter sp.]